MKKNEKKLQKNLVERNKIPIFVADKRSKSSLKSWQINVKR